MSGAQCGPFGGGFLHPAFAEIALAVGDQRDNVVGIVGFGDRDQRDCCGIAFRPGGGGPNSLANQREPGLSRTGQNLKAVPT